MEHNQIFKQMVGFNQAAFNNTFRAMIMLQDQFERVAKTTMDQTNWLPVEGHKSIEAWTETYKTGRDKYKKLMDDSFQKVEEYLAG